MAGRYHKISDLPPSLAIFPLTGVLLLPRAQLPLNVFEPRYLALVDAALSGNRLIGLIQPNGHDEKAIRPNLADVGCAGRITSYRETDDARYLITLTGICRFRVAEEISVITPYRQVGADYAPFAADLADGTDRNLPRERLMAALNEYLARRDLKADWRGVLDAPAETLVNALSMLCPFEPAEKQALLEAPGWHERVDTLLALLEMTAAARGSSTVN